MGGWRQDTRRSKSRHKSRSAPIAHLETRAAPTHAHAIAIACERISNVHCQFEPQKERCTSRLSPSPSAFASHRKQMKYLCAPRVLLCLSRQGAPKGAVREVRALRVWRECTQCCMCAATMQAARGISSRALVCVARRCCSKSSSPCCSRDNSR